MTNLKEQDENSSNDNKGINAAIKSQEQVDNGYFTRKFLIKKSNYRKLVLMATERYYDVEETSSINVTELTSKMLNEIVDTAFNEYKNKRFSDK
ncbi:MAG: hypothetical protein ACK5WP_09120 [Neisseriaceae bacterium]|jgi:hypothetical protein